MSCDIGNDLLDLMNKFRLLGQKYKHFRELSQAEFCMLMTIGQTVMIKKKENIENKAAAGITTTEIVNILGTSLSAASKLLRSIEKKGYIKREACHKDRRLTYIFLSEKGKDVLKDQKAKVDELMNSIIEKMGRENMMQLRDLTAQVYEIMKEEMEVRAKS